MRFGARANTVQYHVRNWNISFIKGGQWVVRNFICIFLVVWMVLTAIFFKNKLEVQGSCMDVPSSVWVVSDRPAIWHF